MDTPLGAKLLFYYLDCKNSIKQKDSMGVVLMVGFSIEERAITLAHYIIDSKDTVRGAAKKYGISKSTVHKLSLIHI